MCVCVCARIKVMGVLYSIKYKTTPCISIYLSIYPSIDNNRIIKKIMIPFNIMVIAFITHRMCCFTACHGQLDTN